MKWLEFNFLNHSHIRDSFFFKYLEETEYIQYIFCCGAENTDEEEISSNNFKNSCIMISKFISKVMRQEYFEFEITL